MKIDWNFAWGIERTPTLPIKTTTLNWMKIDALGRFPKEQQC